MPYANILILTDDTEFARLLTACWQGERQAPELTVLSSDLWKKQEAPGQDLVVIGPLREGRLPEILRSLESGAAVILCAKGDLGELADLRARYPRLVHVPLREDWAQTLLLVAGESLRRAEALKLLRQAEHTSSQNAHYATLGRYMLEMKHSVTNALTGVLGNAELLLFEPGQLSAQSLEQIKTIHSMAMRINEIMQRFSSLASEIREIEKESQAETEEARTGPSGRA